RRPQIPDPGIAHRLRAPGETGAVDEFFPAGPARRAGYALEIVLHDRIHLRIELRDRRAGREPADHVVRFPATLVVAALLVGKRERRPQIGLAVREEEALRHDADDAVVDAVQMQVAADDAGVAGELVLPHAVTEHRDVVVAGLRIV